MRTTTTLFTVFALSITTNAQDEDALRARQRAERPAEPTGTSAARTAGPGNALFSMTGADNSPCVRPIEDVNGDGLADILVGIDKSGTDNVFCVSGASSGSATVLWSVQTNDGASGGSPYGDQCIVPLSDTDGNGKPNFLLGTAWGGRTAYDRDAGAGATSWKFDTYLAPDSGWVYSLCQMEDVTGDGIPESAFGVGSMDDAVYMVNGAPSAGQAPVLWRYDAGDAVYSVRNIGDVNADGVDDVLAAIGDNVDELVCLSGDSASATGTVLWTHDPGTSVFACETIDDLNGDGVREALVCLWTLGGSAVRCIDGASGTQIWASAEVNRYAQMVSTLEDITGDGKPEVIASTWENAVIVLDGSDGSLLWKTTVGTTNGGDVWTARAIDDLNGDGRQDVIAGSFDYHVYALDGDSGQVFWAFNTGNRVYSVHAVPDVNGDGTPEVAVGTQDTNSNAVFHLLEGDAGIAFPGLGLAGTGAISSPMTIEVTGPAGSFAQPAVAGAPTNVVVAPFGGTLGLLPPLTLLTPGFVPAGDAYTLTVIVPDLPGLIGTTIYVQAVALFVGPLSGDFTNVETFVVN